MLFLHLVYKVLQSSSFFKALMKGFGMLSANTEWNWSCGEASVAIAMGKTGWWACSLSTESRVPSV